MSKQGNRECVFCGGKPVTREHVVPRWLANDPKFAHQISGYNPKTRTQVRVTQVDSETAVIYPYSMGTPRLDNLRVRAVCGSCNHQWMSNLENQVIKIIKPLILGDGLRIAKADLEIVERWALKTSFMFQYMDRTTLTVTRQHLGDCYAGRLNRELSVVLIALSTGGQNLNLVHSKLLFAETNDLQIVHGRAGVTVLSLGAVVLTVVSGSRKEALADVIRAYELDFSGQHNISAATDDVVLTAVVDADYEDRVTDPPKRRN